MAPRYANRPTDVANLYEYLDLPDDKYAGLYQAHEARVAESQWALLESMHDLRAIIPVPVIRAEPTSVLRQMPAPRRPGVDEATMRLPANPVHDHAAWSASDVSEIAGGEVRRSKSPQVAPLAQFIAPKGRTRAPSARPEYSPLTDMEGVAPLPRKNQS